MERRRTHIKKQMEKVSCTNPIKMETSTPSATTSR